VFSHAAAHVADGLGGQLGWFNLTLAQVQQPSSARWQAALVSRSQCARTAAESGRGLSHSLASSQANTRANRRAARRPTKVFNLRLGDVCRILRRAACDGHRRRAGNWRGGTRGRRSVRRGRGSGTRRALAGRWSGATGCGRGAAERGTHARTACRWRRQLDKGTPSVAHAQGPIGTTAVTLRRRRPHGQKLTPPIVTTSHVVRRCNAMQCNARRHSTSGGCAG
jgi:hypothetical protein